MVKLSYYFPVSSDSISLKKQLLDSGVLDKTNEIMYRMAPESVDPSILSRGSLSHRRYTRSAILMLRNEILSRKKPSCTLDPLLSKFSFWKTEFNYNHEENIKSKFQIYKTKRFNSHVNNNNDSQNKNINFGPFVKNRTTRIISNEVLGNSKQNEENVQFKNCMDDNLSSAEECGWNNCLSKSKDLNQMSNNFSCLTKLCKDENNFLEIAKNCNDNNNSIFSYNKVLENTKCYNNDKNYMTSANILPEQNKFSKNLNKIENEFYVNTKYKTRNMINFSRNNLNKNLNRNNNITNSYLLKKSCCYGNFQTFNYRNRKDSGSSSGPSCNSEEPEWLRCGPTSKNDIIELHGFEDDPTSDKENESKNSKNLTTKTNLVSIISDDSIKSKMSEIDNIELETKKKKTKVETILVPYNLKENNDEFHSVTNNLPSPPPARSTPTKLLNQKLSKTSEKEPNKLIEQNKITNSLEFGVDNFLDYDTINNVFRETSKGNSHNFFKTNNYAQNQMDLKNSKQENKIFQSPERFLKNAINVKDLEDQMLKVGYHTYLKKELDIQHKKKNESHNNNKYLNLQTPIKPSVNAFTQSAYKQMLAQANLIVKQSQDPEVFKRFLEQINSMNQLAAISQISKPFVQCFKHNLFANSNGTQKRIPSTRELEFYTRNIVQNALMRKKFQEQQQRRLEELQTLTLQSTINPNAPEFTPTSVLRQISAEKEITSFQTAKKKFHEICFQADKNCGSHKINFVPIQKQQYQHLQPLKNSNEKILSMSNSAPSSTAFKSSVSSTKCSEKHIKWDNNSFNQIYKKLQHSGRPILKGSTTNFSAHNDTSFTKRNIQQENLNRKQDFDIFDKIKTRNQNFQSSAHFVEEETLTLSTSALNQHCPKQVYLKKEESSELKVSKSTDFNEIPKIVQEQTTNIRDTNNINN